MRTLGVEEELLLVDAETGRPRSVASEVLRIAAERAEATPGGAGPASEEGGSLGHELHQQQVETDTPPETDLLQVQEDLVAWRRRAAESAGEAGARVLAAGTPPLPAEPQIVADERFEEIAERFGLTAMEQMSCGCHVHVSVESDEEAVAVLDRVRVWLPVLLAMSANSPFWEGGDSSYASYRSQVLGRWPSSGPTDVFGSAGAYRDELARLTATGVLLDEGMVYFDARLGKGHPTVEVRIADVCLDVRDAVLVAGLSRALVETAAREWAAGQPPPDVPTNVLRLTTWQAARYGLEGDLVDPATGRLRPATDVVQSLLDHVDGALRDDGDHELVHAGVANLLERGNGTMRQRRVRERTGRMEDVVETLARVTLGRDG